MYPTDDDELRLRLLLQQVRMMRERVREQMERSAALAERVRRALHPDRPPPRE